MTVGLPSRGWAGPRAGTFAPRQRSALGRAFAKGGIARSWDWPLIVVAIGLSALGAILVWAATEPMLRAAGINPHYYLEKAALWAFLGLILMFVTASIDYRRIRRWTPWLYGVSVLLLLAVLAHGQSVNGAKAWIALPGGFQIEPSEFAKLALVLSAAALISRRARLAESAGQSVNGAKAWIALPGGFQVEPSEFAKLAVVLSTAALLSRRRTGSGRAWRTQTARPGSRRAARSTPSRRSPTGRRRAPRAGAAATGRRGPGSSA